ncbi:MAG: GNAT family N-acetyltransferase [Pseudomonadota bacterium]
MSELRAATAADLPALVALYAAFFREDAVPVPAALQANLAAMLDDQDAMIALLGDPPHGLVSATLTRGAEFGLSAEIEDLYVVPSARGTGLARRLMTHALDWCDRRGARAVSLVVTPEAEAEQELTAFYTRFGFIDSRRRLLIRG